MNLSLTITQMTNSVILDFRSINNALITNIRNFGNTGEVRQVSLQFNIWKQCIEQR